ncbi:MAG: DUF3108 domain-containing protein [Bacteroidetes bacterium]|nr:DUF3108 domain-containing protein [Bacteroidota bacterium]
MTLPLLKPFHFLLVFQLFILNKIVAQNTFCGIQNSAFQVGEKITFKVYYNMGSIWVGAGEAIFSIKSAQIENRQAMHIIGDGRTYSSYDWLYRVRDRYESYLDAETLLPLRFVRNVQEGSTKKYNSVTFDHTKGKAMSDNKIYTVPKCIQDVLSSIYYARNIDYRKYTVGDKIPFTLFLDDQIYSLYIRYLGRERIKTKHGSFQAIKISPLLIEGTIFSGGERMTVWVTDDQNRIPVRIDSPILIGSIKVDMSSVEGLRNPFTARLP